MMMMMMMTNGDDDDDMMMMRSMIYDDEEEEKEEEDDEKEQEGEAFPWRPSCPHNGLLFLNPQTLLTTPTQLIMGVIGHSQEPLYPAPFQLIYFVERRY